MAANARVTVKDKGYAAMLARLRRASESLTVGLHEAEGAVVKTSRPRETKKENKKAEPSQSATEDEATLLEIASYHEFGLGVPRRSFIKDWADENRANHEQQLRQMAKALVQGMIKDWKQGLARLGNLYVGEIQKRISDGIEPELAESTAKAKGSSKPLIDTGQLRSSIRFHIKGETDSAGVTPALDPGGGDEGGD